MRVLLAEDERASRMMLGSLLAKWGYEPLMVEDGKKALHILLGEDPPELALIDWLLPEMEGTEICRKVREEFEGDFVYPYIILLTVKDQKESILQGFEAGVDDYVTKPFDPRELRMRLSVGKRIVELQRALRYQAERDFLTSLMNRRAVMKYLENEMEESRKEKTPLSIAVLDLDHFKRVNDTLGHSAGDDVLQEVAKRILAILQEEGGLVGRSGGEEFLLLFPGRGRREAREICEKVRCYIEERPVHSPKGDVSVTASIGVAGNCGGCSLDEFVNLADSAMYRAKAEGRNRVCLGAPLCEVEDLSSEAAKEN